jgi:hypothetical protein
MNEQHTEQVSSNGTEERPAHKASFPTPEAAKLVKAPSDNFRVFTVTDDDGKQVYAWGQSGDNAISVAARAAGWKAEVTEKKGPALTKERVQARLAELTDAELAEMGLTRKKAKAKK